MTDNLDSNFKKTTNSRDLRLKLSGRCFDKGFEVARDSGFHGKRIKEIYTFDIDLNINPDFLNCDLKDELELFQKEDDKIIFRGIVKDSLIEGNKVRLIAQDFSLKFEYVSIKGLEISPYFEPRDIFSLIILPVEEIKLGNVSGFPENTTMRDFIVIVPVKNLILEEDIKISSIKFYCNFDTLDDKIIRKSGFGKSISDWNRNSVRAKVIVKASVFRTALVEGYTKISTTIDLIALRNDLSFPRLNIKKADEYLNFHYKDFVAQVTIPTWVYCREDETDLYGIFNIEFSKDNVLNPEYNLLKYFVCV